MNDKERTEDFDRIFNLFVNLHSAIGDAGGNSGFILRSYMDRPLRDFLAQVVAPNHIRFEYKPDVHKI